jgi:hypothetical protein
MSTAPVATGCLQLFVGQAGWNADNTTATGSGANNCTAACDRVVFDSAGDYLEIEWNSDDSQWEVIDYSADLDDGKPGGCAV